MAERKANNKNSNESRNNNNSNNNRNKNNSNTRNVNNKENKGERRNGEILDDSKEQADLKGAQNDLNKLKDKNQALSDSIVNLGKKIQECRDEIARIKKSRVNYKDQKSELWATIRKYQDRMNHIKSEKQALIAKKDDIEANLQFKSHKDGLANLVARNQVYYDNKIKEIEDSLHMQNFSSGEVKLKTTQLEKQKAKKALVNTYRDLCLEIDAYREHNNSLFDAVNEYRTKLNNFEKEEQSFTSLIAAQENKIKSLTEEISQLKEQRKQNNVEINASAKIRDEKKAILDKKWEEWKALQSELRKKRIQEAKARRLEYEQQRKEREEQLIKKQEAADAKKILDEAARPPYEAEVKACDSLLKYLKDIKINKQKLDAPLKSFPLNVIIRFEDLSLNAPQLAKDVEASVQAVNDKKKYFLELREVTLQQRKEKKESEKANQVNENQNDKPAEVNEEAAKEEVKVEDKAEEKAEEKPEESKPEEVAEEKVGESPKEEIKEEEKAEEKPEESPEEATQENKEESA